MYNLVCFGYLTILPILTVYAYGMQTLNTKVTCLLHIIYPKNFIDPKGHLVSHWECLGIVQRGPWPWQRRVESARDSSRYLRDDREEHVRKGVCQQNFKWETVSGGTSRSWAALSFWCPNMVSFTTCVHTVCHVTGQCRNPALKPGSRVFSG